MVLSFLLTINEAVVLVRFRAAQSPQLQPLLTREQMATTCTHDLVTPFLTRMLGQMQVLSMNLKCNKQKDGQYLYEYSVQVCPEAEDEDLAALFGSESRSSLSCSSTSNHASSLNASTSTSNLMTTSLISRSSHFEVNCVYMVEVCFVLFHKNMNGKAQLRMKDEFPCYMNVREVIDYFRLETDGVHRGVFAPRLAYTVGRSGDNSHPLVDSDLGKTLAELCGSDQNSSTVTIIADVTY